MCPFPGKLNFVTKPYNVYTYMYMYMVNVSHNNLAVFLWNVSDLASLYLHTSGKIYYKDMAS